MFSHLPFSLECEWNNRKGESHSVRGKACGFLREQQWASVSSWDLAQQTRLLVPFCSSPWEPWEEKVSETDRWERCVMDTSLDSTHLLTVELSWVKFRFYPHFQRTGTWEGAGSITPFTSSLPSQRILVGSCNYSASLCARDSEPNTRIPQTEGSSASSTLHGQGCCREMGQT